MCLDNLSGCELVGLASTLAISFANNLTPDELAKLGSFFTTLGDNLSLLSIESTKCDDSKKREN